MNVTLTCVVKIAPMKLEAIVVRVFPDTSFKMTFTRAMVYNCIVLCIYSKKIRLV